MGVCLISPSIGESFVQRGEREIPHPWQVFLSEKRGCAGRATIEDGRFLIVLTAVGRWCRATIRG